MEQSVSVRTDRTPPVDAPHTGGQSPSKAQEVADKAQQQVGEARGRAREQVRDQVNRRSSEAGERVRSAAGDARSVAEELHRQGKDTPARYAEQAADRAERVGEYLHSADGDRILRDVEDFGRRNPWAVAAGGLALGFVASRLLKASSNERYRASQRTSSGPIAER
jgi:vacuolar-type H+-ATPase subunit H